MSQLIIDRLSSVTSDRKLRLFACACIRQIWDLLKDERSRKVVAGAELYIEGKISEKEFKKAAEENKALFFPGDYASCCAVDAVNFLADTVMFRNCSWDAGCVTYCIVEVSFDNEQVIVKMHQLFDCIFGKEEQERA